MTYPTKPLRIMRDPYGYHHGYEKGEITKVNDSLMSPPLTPTEAHPTESLADDSCWLQPSSGRRRKEFIHSYSKMVPFLRKSNDCNYGSTFALNVYRDIMITTSKGHNDNKKIKEKNSSNCVRLDETVVPLSRKRTANEVVVIEEEDKKKVFKKKRVSSVLPTGKEAAMAFDAIDINSSDQEFYPTGWVPLKEALDRVPVKVCWKGKKNSSLNLNYYFNKTMFQVLPSQFMDSLIIMNCIK